MGIDLGSRSVKIVQMENKKIIDSKLFDTIQFYRQFAKKGAKSLYLEPEKIGFKNDNIIATGYGKITVQIENAKHLPEIQAHVKGAVFQSGLEDFTLIDIGGQDTKVVKVRNSRVVDFMTNDRCAASSGRYMENMANVLGITLEELSSYSDDPVELSSTCAIFGETEIIAKIVEGYDTSQLAAGINYTLFKRFVSLINRMASDIIVLSGGGAKNQALKRIIAKETGSEVITVADPQLNGAIGCCIYGEEIA
ncbi:MAG: 2-hydroxyglutaryl-CoA dehydratase [Syntrophomonadaceae bacterium]|nr:2-hydroxyglutaryl-CoA dehydratase [Syntrophomonadaceae bacterium]